MGYDSRTQEGELSLEQAMECLHASSAQATHSSNVGVSFTIRNEEGRYLGGLHLHADGWELTKPGA